MKGVLVLCLLAAPCWAEPWIDYELLLEQNRDRVVTTTDASGAQKRVLDMGDGVVVTCDASGCFGWDKEGAVGCMWTIYSELLAIAEVCEIPKDQTADLTTVQQLLTAYVARNAVPPRSVAEIEVFHQGNVDRYRGDVATRKFDCKEALAPESDIGMMLEQLMSQKVDVDAAAKEMLSNPRLPVMNPCL